MNEAIALLQETDKIIELGNDGYAKYLEIDLIEKKVQVFLTANLGKESLPGRKFDRWNGGPHYKTKYIGKYADKSYLGKLIQFRQFLTDYIESLDIELPVTQKYVKSGQVYTGSRIIRETFFKAKISIKIQDNFVGTRLLDILEQVLDTNVDIKVNLLTRHSKYKDLKHFIKVYPLFQKQFPNFSVKSSNQIHGRFIIIDDNQVFNPGASIKDLGKKADMFSEITGSKAKKEMMLSFNDCWKSGDEGVSYD